MVMIKIESEHLALQAPYHPALPHRCKQIGGRWMGNAYGWSFSLHEEQAVRDICLDIWGVDGTPSALENMVDLKVTVAEEGPQRQVFQAYEEPVYLVGREIAAALKNHRAARPGRGIKFLIGKPHCFVSPSLWGTSIPNGSVFIIHEVPRVAADRFRKAIGVAGQVVLLNSSGSGTTKRQYGQVAASRLDRLFEGG
jgi:hypothetical protein